MKHREKEFETGENIEKVIIKVAAVLLLRLVVWQGEVVAVAGVVVAVAAVQVLEEQMVDDWQHEHVERSPEHS